MKVLAHKRAIGSAARQPPLNLLRGLCRGLLQSFDNLEFVIELNKGKKAV